MLLSLSTAQSQGQVAGVVSCSVSPKSGLNIRVGKDVMAGRVGLGTA